MQEVIVKCTKVSVTGYKEKDNWKLGTIKIQGDGLNILYFTKEIEKVNRELFKSAFKFDEIGDLIINNHEAIKIIRVPNKKEILLTVNDENSNLVLGVTVFSTLKINFTDVTALESKYGIF